MKKLISTLTFVLLMNSCTYSLHTQEPDNCLQSIIFNKYGAAIYGTGVQYTPDIYLGRLSHGALVELIDCKVRKNEFDRPIIKVKVLNDKGYGSGEVGRTGWVSLTDTNFVDLYNPATQCIDPSLSPRTN